MMPPRHLRGPARRGRPHAPRGQHFRGLGCLAAPSVRRGVWQRPQPTPGLTEENARRLRAGMTLEQVEALFGCAGVRCSFRFPRVKQSYCWRAVENGLFVTVELDDTNHLTRAYFYGDSIVHINVNESFLEWFRRMLRL